LFLFFVEHSKLLRASQTHPQSAVTGTIFSDGQTNSRYRQFGWFEAFLEARVGGGNCLQEVHGERIRVLWIFFSKDCGWGRYIFKRRKATNGFQSTELPID